MKASPTDCRPGETKRRCTPQGQAAGLPLYGSREIEGVRPRASGNIGECHPRQTEKPGVLAT